MRSQRIICVVLCAALCLSMTGCQAFLEEAFSFAEELVDKAASLGAEKSQSSDSGGESSDSASIAPPEDLPFPVTVYGAEVTGEPKRIVSFSPAASAIIQHMGEAGRLVGTSDHDPIADDGTVRVGTALSPDVEALFSLDADLVIVQSGLPQDTLKRLNRQGIPVAVVPMFSNLIAMSEVYIAMGTLLWGQDDGPKKGAAAADSMLRTLSGWKDEVGEDAVSAVFLVSMAPAAATADTFEWALLEAVGFTSVTGDLRGYAITLDELKEMNPYLLIVPDSVTIKDLEGMAVYQGLTSVLRDRVAMVEPMGLESGGNGALEQLREILTVAYPDKTFA